MAVDCTVSGALEEGDLEEEGLAEDGLVEDGPEGKLDEDEL